MLIHDYAVNSISRSVSEIVNYFCSYCNLNICYLYSVLIVLLIRMPLNISYKKRERGRERGRVESLNNKIDNEAICLNFCESLLYRSCSYEFH